MRQVIESELEYSKKRLGKEYIPKSTERSYYRLSNENI